MINKWISIDTLLDNVQDELSSAEISGAEDRIRRIAIRQAYSLLNACNAPSQQAPIKTGIIKNGMIELPDDCSEVTGLKVNDTPVNVGTDSRFLRNNTSSNAYKAKIIGEVIMFTVVGGKNELDGSNYQLEYNTYPFINGTLYIPFDFENAIIEHLRYVALRQKIETAGRGQGLLQTAYRIKEDAKQKAIIDVDFPSWDEWVRIGQIWESKVPVRVKKGFDNDFNNI